MNRVNDLEAISAHEVGFALALFLAIATGRLSNSQASTAESERDGRQIYTILILYEMKLVPQRSYSDNQGSLYRIFQDFWRYYDDCPQQASICARVLAFHLLMERTSGAAVLGWTTEGDDEATVFLHPAVIDAVGKVSMNRQNVLFEYALGQQIVSSAQLIQSGIRSL